jgi:hypothetical protein
METFNKVRRRNWFWILFSLSCGVSGCQQTGFQTQSSKGFVDIGKSIEQAYNRLSTTGRTARKPASTTNVLWVFPLKKEFASANRSVMIERIVSM